MITEAVYLKANREEAQMQEEAKDKQQREEWKKAQIADLEKFRGGFGN